MAKNECIPFYDDADVVTGFCSAPVTGKRFVKISGDRQTAGNTLQVAHADVGGKAFGVSGFDGATGEYIPCYRGSKMVLPVLCSGALAAFDEVSVGAAGVAVKAGARVDAVAASLLTGVVGTNNAIRWTSRENGADGNAIQVAIVVAGLSTALSVVTAGNLITVNSATDGAGAATSTATAVIAAIRANAAANDLVTVANELASTGAGVVAAVAPTNLAGGADESEGGRAVGYAITAALDATDAQISLY